MKTTLTALLAFCLCLPLMGDDAAKKKFEETRAKAEKGDADAQWKLGDMYLWGVPNQGSNGRIHPNQVVFQNWVKAEKWIRKSAEQGNTEGIFLLAAMYRLGRIPDPNPPSNIRKFYITDKKKAGMLFRKAAEQGHPRAQWIIGNAYVNGGSSDGEFPEYKKDWFKAMKWFRKAAEQGEVGAQIEVYELYLGMNSMFRTPVNGPNNGRKIDYVTGYAWKIIADANGDKESLNNPKNIARRILRIKITPEQIAKAEALAKEMIKKNPKLLK